MDVSRITPHAMLGIGIHADRFAGQLGHDAISVTDLALGLMAQNSDHTASPIERILLTNFSVTRGKIFELAKSELAAVGVEGARMIDGIGTARPYLPRTVKVIERAIKAVSRDAKVVRTDLFLQVIKEEDAAFRRILKELDIDTLRLTQLLRGGGLAHQARSR